MDYMKKLKYQSGYWYNEGLRKAQMHDLSGAITSLKRSLQYNRENIQARNLLGLVYYGQGEVTEALVQWIISKNFKSHENIANYYIKKVQESAGELETINQAVHKYNQCLQYCKQNGEDLAIIQLKKIISVHPNFLKAYQLLALLYIHTEQYAQARQLLRKAHKMDITNEITLHYMHELNQMRGKKVAKIKKEEKGQAVTYNLGNETIIQPAASVALKEHAPMMTLLNVVIGILVGAAVIWFLIVPAVDQKKASDTNKSIVALSEEVSSRDIQISTLKDELESYRSASTETENALQTAKSTEESYEALIKVYAQFEGGQTSNADMLEGLLAVNQEALGEEGKAIYTKISEDLFPKMCERLYKSAEEALAAGTYTDAISDLEQVLLMDASYEEGSALKLLGDAYAGAGEKEKAKDSYEKVLKDYAGKKMEEEAKKALDSLGTEGQTE